MILCFVCVNDCFEVVWGDNVAVTECLVICEGNVRWPSSAQHNTTQLKSKHKLTTQIFFFFKFHCVVSLCLLF